MEMYLFDTCTLKCAYCGLAEQGLVLDHTQLLPYKDKEFIKKVVEFFSKRTTDSNKWIISLTGGEPLLMPNFEYFAELLWQHGNKIAVYTALLVGKNNAALRYLIDKGPSGTDYLMVSFHPEAERRETEHFLWLERLKRAGHSVIFRFVSHPKRLDRMNALAAKCKELDIAFYPTPLFSPAYPSAYTPDERKIIEQHISSLSQLIQLENGLDTTSTLCKAGSDLFAVYMRSGNVTPCISVSAPIIGNIYDDWLNPFNHLIRCPEAGVSCICDIHFQQATVDGADDRDAFAKQKHGFVPPVAASELRSRLTKLNYSRAKPNIGQTSTADLESLSASFVKQAFMKNKSIFLNHYASQSHSEYRKRQLGKTG
jgi:MoaA/NifB/PqqE/SkfB family radical SAM enzyme